MTEVPPATRDRIVECLLDAMARGHDFADLAVVITRRGNPLFPLRQSLDELVRADTRDRIAAELVVAERDVLAAVLRTPPPTDPGTTACWLVRLGLDETISTITHPGVHRR